MLKKLTILLVCGAILAACSSDPIAAVKTEADTASKINLSVLTLNVVDRSTLPSGESPYVTNNFQPTIAAAARQWATQKLGTTGLEGQAIFVIKDASLIEQALPHEDSMFERNQASKYTAHVAAEIVVSGREGQGRVTAEASRYETLPENPTALERQNTYTRILNGLIHDLAAKLRDGIQNNLAPFVVTAPILDATPRSSTF